MNEVEPQAWISRVSGDGGLLQNFTAQKQMRRIMGGILIPGQAASAINDHFSETSGSPRTLRNIHLMVYTPICATDVPVVYKHKWIRTCRPCAWRCIRAQGSGRRSRWPRSGASRPRSTPDRELSTPGCRKTERETAFLLKLHVNITNSKNAVRPRGWFLTWGESKISYKTSHTVAWEDQNTFKCKQNLQRTHKSDPQTADCSCHRWMWQRFKTHPRIQH